MPHVQSCTQTEKGTYWWRGVQNLLAEKKKKNRHWNCKSNPDCVCRAKTNFNLVGNPSVYLQCSPLPRHPQPHLKEQNTLNYSPRKKKVNKKKMIKITDSSAKAIKDQIPPFPWGTLVNFSQLVLTSISWQIAHLIYLVWLHWCLLGTIVLQHKLTAFVERAAQVGLPLGWIRLINTLLVLPCLQRPGLFKKK